MARQPKGAKPGATNAAAQRGGKSDKAGGESVGRMERLRQIRTAFQITRQRDKRLVPYMLVTFVVVTGLIELAGFLVGHVLLYIVPAVLIGALSAMMIFGRRAQRAAYTQVEGQPGAAAWVLQNMRGDWRTTPSVAGNAQLDTVHRVLGKPGVILIAEGSPHRVRSLLAQEKRRVARVAGDTPIYDIVVGDEADQVPLKRLSSYLVKLPRNINTKQIGALETRLQALGGGKAAGLPKGPVPQRAQRNLNERSIRRR